MQVASRVIHVASGREWRGGQHQVLLLARGLSRYGVDTTVVTGDGTELARRLQADRVPVELVKWPHGIEPRVAIRLAKLLSHDTIVHAHDSHSHVLADAVARLRHVPLVATRRVAFPIRSPRRYRRADALIAISAAVRTELLTAGVDPARIRIVPDAIDPDDLVEAGAPALALPPGTPHVVCVAALTREKGIDTLLEAAALLHVTHPSARWTVVGEGPERHTLETERRRLGLDDVVNLPGAAASAAMAFRHATLVVQPSRSEGLGSAVLQALALGTPVIASNAGGLCDALGHGGGILVPPESPVELSRAVARLLDDPAERTRLGALGSKAAGWFAVDLLVERTLDVYRSMAHFPGSR